MGLETGSTNSAVSTAAHQVRLGPQVRAARKALAGTWYPGAYAAIGATGPTGATGATGVALRVLQALRLQLLAPTGATGATGARARPVLHLRSLVPTGATGQLTNRRNRRYRGYHLRSLVLLARPAQ